MARLAKFVLAAALATIVGMLAAGGPWGPF
jgi:hypothetical protein